MRFGEFLLIRNRISDEQWLAALAEHWSGSAIGRYRPFGTTIVDRGILARDEVEAEARVFHEEIDIVEA